MKPRHPLRPLATVLMAPVCMAAAPRGHSVDQDALRPDAQLSTPIPLPSELQARTRSTGTAGERSDWFR